MNKNSNELNFSGVEETALLTLYARAIESRKDNPILKDEKAEEIAARLDELHQQHTGGSEKHYFSRTFDARLAIHIPLRSKKFDEYTRAFIMKRILIAWWSISAAGWIRASFAWITKKSCSLMLTCRK